MYSAAAEDCDGAGDASGKGLRAADPQSRASRHECQAGEAPVPAGVLNGRAGAGFQI